MGGIGIQQEPAEVVNGVGEQRDHMWLTAFSG